VTQNLGASYGITGHLYGDMSARVGLLAFGLGLVIAVVGTAPPALRAVAIQPVEAMRSRR
jgi:ABC-type lipoprotein release transport system permease subunit